MPITSSKSPGIVNMIKKELSLPPPPPNREAPLLLILFELKLIFNEN